MGDGFLATIVGGGREDAGDAVVLGEPGGDGALRLVEDALGESNIGALGDQLAPIFAHIVLEFFATGKDEHAAGLAIQAMDHEDGVARMLTTYVGTQDRERGGLGRLRTRRYGEQARTLVDDEQVLILVEQRELGVR